MRGQNKLAFSVLVSVVPGTASHFLDKAIHHPLLASLVELHDQLVAVDGGDVAVAEFLVEDAVADGEVGDGAGGFGDQLAFDGDGEAAGFGAAGAAAGGDPLTLSLPRRKR